MAATNLELVSDAYTLVTLRNNSKVLFKLNQCFLDRNPKQTEALLQPHQMRAFGVVVDDCASCHLGPSLKPGGQCLTIADTSYGMHFDGWKCYFRAQKPTTHDLVKYPIIELTSGQPYEPQRRYSHRVPGIISPNVSTWRARLG